MRYADIRVTFEAESLSDAFDILQELEQKDIIEVTGPNDIHTDILYDDLDLWGEYHKDFDIYVIGARYSLPEENLEYVHQMSGAIMRLREDIEDKTDYSFEADLGRPIET